MKFKCMSIIVLCLTWTALFSHQSPFKIDFPEKLNLSNEDYAEIQNQIRQIDILPLLTSLYEDCKLPGYIGFNDFNGRCTKCINQNLVDPTHTLNPIRELVQIGTGGNKCIVSCGPFNGKYPQYIESLVQGLKDNGFNGYLLYYIGGWPNPTGKEIQYVAVPYSFKIFAMVDAYKSGFSNVLWIDAACYPLRNLDPLFNIIEKKGALLNWWQVPPNAYGYIFPKTHALLKELTGTDVLKASYINSIFFGLKMDTPQAQELVKIYYDLAELGTPFLSSFPEEWVLTAIIGKNMFAHWRSESNGSIIQGSINNKEDSAEEFDLVRQRGCFFYQRRGR